VIHQPLSRPKQIRAGEYAVGRKLDWEGLTLNVVSAVKYFNVALFTVLNHEINLVFHAHPHITLQRNSIYLVFMLFIYVRSLLYRAKLCALLNLAVDFCEYAVITVFLVFTGKLTSCLM
jgi:uncharacterized membrane protein YjgN (DUF898 family)